MILMGGSKGHPLKQGFSDSVLLGIACLPRAKQVSY